MDVQLTKGESSIKLSPENKEEERFLDFLTTLTLDGGQIILRSRPNKEGECEQLTYDINKPAGRMSNGTPTE